MEPKGFETIMVQLLIITQQIELLVFLKIADVCNQQSYQSLRSFRKPRWLAIFTVEDKGIDVLLRKSEETGHTFNAFFA